MQRTTIETIRQDLQDLQNQLSRRRSSVSAKRMQRTTIEPFDRIYRIYRINSVGGEAQFQRADQVTQNRASPIHKLYFPNDCVIYSCLLLVCYLILV